ncbi:MAG TPA: DUF1501 domain-containing protein [Planctomycetota bacterium]|nr:DUF1501 domain-containing protein [Planctomycetota bacterium]
MDPRRDSRWNHERELSRLLARRRFLQSGAAGLGSLAFASLLSRDLCAAQESTPPFIPAPHFAPKAKSIIWLFMNGGPSQLDLFDPKPALEQLDGKPVPESFTQGERFAFIEGTPTVLKSPYKFAKHGTSGAEVSELLPHFPEIADEVTIVRSVVTEAFNHAPAELFLNTGLARIGRPSMGSWLSYGLGSSNQDLPGFVVLLSGGGQPSGGNACWSSGFLPGVHQGVQLRSKGDPVLFVDNPPGMSDAARRASLDALAVMNSRHLEAVGDPEIATRMAAYELAYRMQSSVPELMDIASESESVRSMYGVVPGEVAFSNNCLLARRLVERGVRFVQLYHRGWDHHGTGTGDDIVHSLPELCRQTDQAAAALIRDLKARGLLDTTLVVWGGEFGRTPMNERRNGSTFLGRDHHPRAFTMWFAGGGVKRGTTIGETDEIGYHVTKDPLGVHDLHATLLHQLGLEHTRLTYRSQGRDFRLTDVSGEVFRPLLA